MGDEIDLGFSFQGLDEKKVRAFNDAINDAINANFELDKSLASTFDIQRRGQHYPGDTNSFSPFGVLDRGITGINPMAPFFGRDPYASALISSAFGLGGLDGLGCGIHNATGGSLSTMGSSISRVAKVKMAMCVQAYKGFGVAKNVIDLMANFASEGLKIQHPRPAIQRFYQRWAELVDLSGRVKDILRYYYKYGNVFIYTTFGLIDQAIYNAMKNAKANFSKAVTDTQDPARDERQKKVDEEKSKPAAAKQIPWRYTLLNPFQMDLVGDKFFGTSKWVFVLDENTFNNLSNQKRYENQDFLDETDVNLPPEFKSLVDEKNKGGEASRLVNLKPENLWTMHYMKDDHEDWADPMLWPVMADINYKNKLRQSDISVCNSIIKAVTVFKIGDYKNGFIPDANYMRKFSELLRTPTEAMTLVWNDAISIDHSYPPIEKLLSIAKYEAVDKDILRGLGVPDLLLGGSGGNYSSGFLGVRTLLERLEEGRREVEKWVNKQLRMIAEIMGHRDIPKIKFGRMSLRDENAEKQLILGLFDRNVISAEAVLEVFGEDFELELARLRREEEIRDTEGILIKHGPFVDPLADMTQTEVIEHEDEVMDKQQKMELQKMDKQMKQQMQFKKMDNQIKKQTMLRQQRIQKQQGQKPKGINGRPGNSKGIPQQKKRNTKPKGMAFLTQLKATNLYSRVEEVITSAILSSTGKKFKKALTKEDRTGIEELSFAVASYLPLDEDVSLDRVKQVMAQTPLVVSPDVAEIEKILHSAFVVDRNSSPTADERRYIRSQAIAMAHIEEEEDAED